MGTRLMLVDDHAGLLGENFPSWAKFPEYSEFELSCQATNEQEARQLVAKCKPDVVLIDIRLPASSDKEDWPRREVGLRCITYIADNFPNIKIVAIAGDPWPEEFIREIETAGAHAYVYKREALWEDVLEKVKLVKRGMTVFPGRKRCGVGKRANMRLNEREQEVWRLIAEDSLDNSELAKKLSLAEGYVRHIVSDLEGKLNVKNRAHLVKLWYDRYYGRGDELVDADNS